MTTAGSSAAPQPLTRPERREATIRGLAFTSKLSMLYQGGLRLRDAEEFPGRGFLIAHAAREIGNRLPEYIFANAGGTKPKKHEAQVNRELAKRWAAAVTGEMLDFANAEPGAESVVRVPLDLARDLDPIMQHHLGVQGTVLARRITQCQPIVVYIGDERLSTILDQFSSMRFEKYAHVNDPDDYRPEAESLALWDRVEELLFELVGSPAWGYSLVDSVIEGLNAL